MLKAKNIASLLKRYRKRMNLTQAEFAIILGVSQSQISQWEAKVHTPNSLRLKDINRKICY